jgi:hypothetical protein
MIIYYRILTISRENILFLYNKLRNFIDSLEKNFLMNTKRQQKTVKENSNKMEIDENDIANDNDNDNYNDDDEIIEVNAERLKLTYSRNDGKINPNKIEVFSMK